MTTHIKVLAVLSLVGGALGLIGAVFSTLIFGALGIAMAGEEDKVGLAVIGLTGVAFTVSIGGICPRWRIAVRSASSVGVRSLAPEDVGSVLIGLAFTPGG